MPARQWSRVDLPEPLGPITATISPRVMETLGATKGRGLPEGKHEVSRLDEHAPDLDRR